MAEWRLRDCLEQVRRHARVPPQVMRKIDRLVRDANRLIHAKREAANPTQEEALKGIRDVVAYAERLLA